MLSSSAIASSTIRLVVALLILHPMVATAGGQFSGSLVLLPKDCQKTEPKICKLGAPLRYKGPDGIVWEAKEWTDGDGDVGTTDGASIPTWAQGIIGDPYDESYLKAAIVHDHYCHRHVRSWRSTHRMFYDALIDLGLNAVKAKTMYFAVYTFGPHWVNLIKGKDCGDMCIQTLSPSGVRAEGDEYLNENWKSEINKINAALERKPDMSLDELEKVAKQLRPDYFFFSHGDSYTPTGPDDPNAAAAM